MEDERMKTAFQVGQIVTNEVDAQELVRGEKYEIVDLRYRTTITGPIVTYYVLPVDTNLRGLRGLDEAGNLDPIVVGNGHLVLSLPRKLARIEYTVEVRGVAKRRAKEVSADRVDREVDKLVDRGAFNFDIRYES